LAAFFLADFLVGFFLAAAPAPPRFLPGALRGAVWLSAAAFGGAVFLPADLPAAPFFPALLRLGDRAPGFFFAAAPPDWLPPAFRFACLRPVFRFVAIFRLQCQRIDG
jgi:hypothetical protein